MSYPANFVPSPPPPPRMTISAKRKSLFVLAASVAVLLASSGVAKADSATWTGANSSEWTDNGNWTAIFPNGAGDVATFDSTATRFTPTISGSSSPPTITVANFTIASGAPVFTFTVDGSAGTTATLTFAADGVINNSSNTQLFTVNGNGTNTASVTFSNSASAGTHVTYTLTNGGTVFFTGTSQGGSAAFVNTSGTLDISQQTGGVTVGSIAGGGTFSLGGNTLTTGTDNTSTSVTGVIQNGGAGGGTGGILTKVGTGTLVLSGASTYTGGTNLTNGGLFLDDTSFTGSSNAIGTGPLTITNTAGGTTTLGSDIAFQTLSNTVNVKGDFSIANPNQDFFFAGTVNLAPTTGTAVTITGLTSQGQVHFSGGITGATPQTGVTFVGVSGPYTAFIYDGFVPTTYRGLTTVGSGAFVVLEQSISNQAIIGNILVNSGGSLDLLASNQTATNITLTVNSSGIFIPGTNGAQFQGFEMQTFSNTIGTLNGSAAGTVGIGTGVLTVSDGNFAGNIVDSITTGTLTAVSSGSTYGTLSKVGPGALTLSGVNTYQAKTNVSNGVFQAGSSTGFSPNSAMTVVTPGIVDVNGFNPTVGSLAGNGTVTNTSATPGTLITGLDFTDTTFTGSLQDGAGSLGLLKTGGGVFTITNSTYSGATTVLQGTLRAGSTTAFSSKSSYEVDAPGVIDLNGFNNSTGSINGTGTVTNLGASPAVLTTGLDGTVGIFGGTIQDGTSTTALVKTGTGGLVLTSPNTYSGGTVLQDGALAIGSPFALGRGNLTVTGGNLQAIGATQDIQVGGNYKQTGGELDLRIGGATTGTFDRLAVVGTAVLGGRLNVTSTNGFIPPRGTSLTVVVADQGVSGKFDQLTGDLATMPFLKLSVEYLPDEVVLEFGGTNFSTIIDLTPNQRAIAAAIDNMTINAKSNRALNYIDTLPLASLPAAFDRIAPEEYGTIFQMSRSAAKMIATSVENRLDAVHATHAPNGAGGPDGPADAKSANEPGQPDTPIGVFANANGEFVRVGDSSNSAGYNFDSGGVTFGADYRFNDNFVAGALFNYTRTRADLVDNGRIDSDSFRGGVYASLFGGGYYVNGFLGAGYNDYDVRRAGLDATVRGNTSGGEFNGLIQTGYDKHIGGLTFGPVASFQYTYIGMSSLDEQGSLAPLHVSSSKGESIRTNVGFRTSYDWHIGHFILSPEIRATYQHEFGDNNDQTTANFLFGSPNFTVTSSPIGRDSLLLNVGFTLTINPQVSAYVFYDGEVGRTNYQDNSILVGVRANF